MLPTEPPHPTGRVIDLESLDGCLFFASGTPPRVMPLQLTSGPLATAIFSSPETLERFRSEFPHLAEGRVLRIDDTRAFLEQVPIEVCVALDLHRTPQGTVKYQAIHAPAQGLDVRRPAR